MDRRITWFYGSLIVTISSALLLVTGSSLLTKSFGSSVPLGTFTTWMGMIFLPLTIYWGVRELRNPTRVLNAFLSRLLKVVIIMAILWVPISYLLAGNLSFSFSEKETFQGGQSAMMWFWRYSYSIGIGAISILFTYWISLLFTRKETVANID